VSRRDVMGGCCIAVFNVIILSLSTLISILLVVFAVVFVGMVFMVFKFRCSF